MDMNTQEAHRRYNDGHLFEMTMAPLELNEGFETEAEKLD